LGGEHQLVTGIPKNPLLEFAKVAYLREIEERLRFLQDFK
jgi:hypothetical protein